MTIRLTSNQLPPFHYNNRSDKVKIPVGIARNKNITYKKLVNGYRQTLTTIVEIDERASEDELYSTTSLSVFIRKKTTLTKSHTYHKLPPPPLEDDDNDESLDQCEKKIEKKMMALTNQLLQQQKKQDNHSAVADTSSRAFLEGLENEISRLHKLEEKIPFPMSKRREAQITKHKANGVSSPMRDSPSVQTSEQNST